jgi:hypothetical protein
MLKGLPVRFAGGFFLLFAVSLALPAQSAPCPPPAALLSSSDPAYADAMELKQVLENHGFAVQCIFHTKLSSMFMVDVNGTLESTVEGEFSFNTNRGGIGVVFVPKPQTFADFKITEHREDGGYAYTFSGTPRVHGDKVKMGTAYRNYFLKQDNRLFIVGDSLLALLENALHLPPPTL